MNGLVSFRLCKLSTPELLEKVEKLTDGMYKSGEIPTRHIPARPDSDYDLLVGELVKRMQEHEAFINKMEQDAKNLFGNPIGITAFCFEIEKYLSRPYGTPPTAP